MATYTIKINERTALGKSILNLLRNTDIVEFEALRSKSDPYEDKVERNLGRLMDKSLKSKSVSRESVLKALE